MKGIFIAYNQAFNEEITDLLGQFGQRGYTLWTEVGGRGSVDGEPHLGNHAWPTQNHALFAVVADERVDEILAALRRTDTDNPLLGLRAYVWNIEQAC